MTPAERTLRARIGAHVQHARHDPQQTTEAARTAFLRRFEAEVDPEGVLAPDERVRRAASARRAHFARLALRSAQARARRPRTGHPEPEPP
jgi:hypothetical protein